ncbi:MAG TPA: hypothetical protein VNS34_27045 [Rhizobiaceae bacterium]|nr:hypothetical protein [Rhizobiaceae bacterium]
MAHFAALLVATIQSWPLIEAFLLAFWLKSILAAWRNADSTKEDDVEERHLGADVILAQLNGVITGSSIIVAGIGAFLAISEGVSPPASWNFRWAACYSILGMALAMYTLGTLPSRAPTQNFVRSKAVAVLCSIALFFALVGGGRFAMGAIVSIERPKPPALSAPTAALP